VPRGSDALGAGLLRKACGSSLGADSIDDVQVARRCGVMIGGRRGVADEDDSTRLLVKSIGEDSVQVPSSRGCCRWLTGQIVEGSVGSSDRRGGLARRMARRASWEGARSAVRPQWRRERSRPEKRERAFGG
jgi:hypothetical protein